MAASVGVPLFVVLIVLLYFKNVVEGIMQRFSKRQLMNLKKKLNDISEEIKGERLKLKYFKRYIRV
jgi:hypothetical protein